MPRYLFVLLLAAGLGCSSEPLPETGTRYLHPFSSDTVTVAGAGVCGTLLESLEADAQNRAGTIEMQEVRCQQAIRDQEGSCTMESVVANRIANRSGECVAITHRTEESVHGLRLNMVNHYVMPADSFRAIYQPLSD